MYVNHPPWHKAFCQTATYHMACHIPNVSPAAMHVLHGMAVQTPLLAQPGAPNPGKPWRTSLRPQRQSLASHWPNTPPHQRQSPKIMPPFRPAVGLAMAPAVGGRRAVAGQPRLKAQRGASERRGSAPCDGCTALHTVQRAAARGQRSRRNRPGRRRRPSEPAIGHLTACSKHQQPPMKTRQPPRTGASRQRTAGPQRVACLRRAASLIIARGLSQN